MEGRILSRILRFSVCLIWGWWVGDDSARGCFGRWKLNWDGKFDRGCRTLGSYCLYIITQRQTERGPERSHAEPVRSRELSSTAIKSEQESRRANHLAARLQPRIDKAQDPGCFIIGGSGGRSAMCPLPFLLVQTAPTVSLCLEVGCNETTLHEVNLCEDIEPELRGQLLLRMAYVFTCISSSCNN